MDGQTDIDSNKEKNGWSDKPRPNKGMNRLSDRARLQ